MSESRMQKQTRNPRLALVALVLGAALTVFDTEAAAQDIKLSPSSLEFGRVTATKTRKVKVQNKGSADLMVSSVDLCNGTSSEFSFVLASQQIPARRSADLEVTYAPTDAGADAGCLAITSNDPDEGLVQLGLSGTGARPDGGELRLRPAALDFGQVAIGTVATRTFQVQTTGGASLDVAVGLCAGTTTEFAPNPAMLTVAPGRGAGVDVTYQPADTGADTGCVELLRADGAQGPLQLRLAGAGVDQAPPAAALDLDIHDFKVKKESRLKAAQAVNIRLWVKNAGSVDGLAPATVVGSQNGAVVYQNTLMVSDRPGNEGVSKYSFPAFTPTQTGDVVWTATIDDGDPDVDTATAVTRVIGDTVGSTGVDLDIRRFRVTTPVSLAAGKAVQLRLAVKNNGDLDEPRDATLVGMQDGVEVVNETLQVADSPGNGGATNYRFMPFSPASVGEIIWMVVIDDDDADLDEAFAVTRVRP